MEFSGKERPGPVKRGLRATGSVFAALITAVLLTILLLGSGDTRAPAAAGGGAKIMDTFEMAVGNKVSDALEGVLSLGKSYWLSDDVLTAPRPDPQKGGTVTEPGALEPVLKAAEETFGPLELIFTPETEIAPDSEIRYYLDDTIFSLSWKQVLGHCVYSFSEVRIAHPSQLRRFLSGGEFGSGVLYTATDMADSVNAVTAMSGDYYSYRPSGVTVYNGEICRAAGDYLDLCFVDDKGDLQLVKAFTLGTDGGVDTYVAEHNIRFSLAFGPILLEDGEVAVSPAYPLGEVEKHYSRAAICQQGPLHYVAVTANTGVGNTRTPTMTELAQQLQALGIRKAYALDGGQTATMVANNEIFNNVDYGQQRLISDIIYFATAIPEK